MPSVQSFMVPAELCITCYPQDKCKDAIAAMTQNVVGCVVVVDPETSKPVGIFTKSDAVKAWLDGRPIDTPLGDGLMKTTLHPVQLDASRDTAAASLEEHQQHHGVVVDGEGAFAGIFSSWDIARECSLDAKAWPWTRKEKSPPSARAGKLLG